MSGYGRLFCPSLSAEQGPVLSFVISIPTQGRFFFCLILYNENKTSRSLETLQRFENEVFLKSLLTNLRYN